MPWTLDLSPRQWPQLQLPLPLLLTHVVGAISKFLQPSSRHREIEPDVEASEAALTVALLILLMALARTLQLTLALALVRVGVGHIGRVRTADVY